jgi:hypothetical protein
LSPAVSPTDSAQVFIVNTVIGNNSRGRIYTQVTDGADSRWRFFHTTINNPASQEGGIDGLTKKSTSKQGKNNPVSEKDGISPTFRPNKELQGELGQ